MKVISGSRRKFSLEIHSCLHRAHCLNIIIIDPLALKVKRSGLLNKQHYIASLNAYRYYYTENRSLLFALNPDIQVI